MLVISALIAQACVNYVIVVVAVCLVCVCLNDAGAKRADARLNAPLVRGIVMIYIPRPSPLPAGARGVPWDSLAPPSLKNKNIPPLHRGGNSEIPLPVRGGGFGEGTMVYVYCAHLNHPTPVPSPQRWGASSAVLA